MYINENVIGEFMNNEWFLFELLHLGILILINFVIL